jgi:hypothetical protein
MNTKQCLECKRDFFGRADKKFCSDGCRNSHNNRLHASDETIVKRVNRILRKNRNILSSLNPEDKIKLPIDKLTKNGFDFDVITSIYRTKDGRDYRFCYEHGYLLLDESYVLLVKRNASES